MKATPEDKKLTGQHVLGSPTYMSPEQLRNATNLDPRADLWSLGVVGYELLSGVPPFDGDGVGEIFAAILEQTPVPLHERASWVPAAVSAERWADAAEVARALAPWGSDATAVTVDRTEQVLARARMMATPKTPIEARRVVDAIDAAAERAKAHDTAPVLLVARRKEPAPVGMSGRFHAFAQRSPMKVGVLAAALTLVLGIGVLGAAFAATRRPVVAPMTKLETAVAAPPPAVEPPPVNALEPDPEPVVAAPVATVAVPSVSARMPAKPGKRPKFLKTRE